MLRIEIETENAAFEDKANECAWILRELAVKLDNEPRQIDQGEYTLRDSNGNYVGKALLS